MTTTILIALVVPAAFIVAVFFLAARLVRRRMQSPDAPPHWLLDDSRELEDAFVDFFASSKTSAGVLGVLAARPGSVGFKALTRELQGSSEDSAYHEDLPLTAVRAVLKIFLSAGLARMCAKGFSITALGMEVHRRMRERSGESIAREAGKPSVSESLDHSVV